MAHHVTVDDERFCYDVFGGGSTTVVLLHATLCKRSMQRPLAERLARSGYRVITLDLVGTPVSGRHDPARFGSDQLAFRMLSALDAIGVDEFVVGGASVGSVVSLEIALRAPDRVRGLILEGPFLENGTAFAAYLWSTGLLVYALGGPVLAPVAALVRTVPRGAHVALDVALDFLGLDPAEAAAWLRGMFYHRMGPSSDERRLVTAPALILGFPGDPFHPLSDARQLAGELPNADLQVGGTIADLRLRPARLTAAIAAFLDGLDRVAVVRERGTA